MLEKIEFNLNTPVPRTRLQKINFILGDPISKLQSIQFVIGKPVSKLQSIKFMIGRPVNKILNKINIILSSPRNKETP